MYEEDYEAKRQKINVFWSARKTIPVAGRAVCAVYFGAFPDLF